jgi:5-methylthioadenosine/S-adenosylhomocysteine deaminase
MPGLLIENGYLLTVNSSNDIFPDGYLLIEADSIVAIGDGKVPDSIRSQADEVIDASGQIVMPGLVNSHVHLQQTLVRGLADDREVWDWVQNVAFPVERWLMKKFI